jgi:demethylmenaquinone methyltransferase/2-methoxy-6-polyprenyl-1,4-benzoquinol methylase
MSDPAWNDKLLTDPHAVADKQRRVRDMFAAIAPAYDLNNRLHSLGRDQVWRRRAVRLARVSPGELVIDVACGTGDLAMAFERTGARVIGIDYTFEMLPIARSKSESITWLQGDARALPLPDACADVVSIAFGIRNVQDPTRALGEFRRILKPGGRLVILEFSKPTNPLLRWGNDFYTSRIMPHTATWISGDRSGAYKYLPKSVETFIDRLTMVRLMQDARFGEVAQHPFTFGVCVCYVGRAA